MNWHRRIASIKLAQAILEIQRGGPEGDAATTGQPFLVSNAGPTGKGPAYELKDDISR